MFHCQRILVPLDGSELAERALPSALAIARAMAGQGRCVVHLLRVVPPLFLALDPPLYAETLSLSEAEAGDYLALTGAKWSEAGVLVRTAVTSGPAAEEILAYAQKQDIDLLVMSSHGRSGFGRWVYGSVTEKVLRQACCASLIIRPGEVPPPVTFRKMLVCLDGSPLAEQVLQPVLTLAQAMSAAVCLLRVVPPALLAVETYAMAQLLSTVDEMERDTADAYLRQLLVSLPVADLPISISMQTVMGPAAEAILDTAVSQNADLIAMCSHGRSGIGRWVYGSVTEKVLRGATCATFIIRGSPNG
ncbi:MAG: universal stress protein [Chloroflexi bacterium]|nr:universal stress protein [Chloroflexota bacterium]